jgi:hypothetical protein
LPTDLNKKSTSIKSKPQPTTMGNTIPYRIPRSSLECIDPDTGNFSHELYHLFKRQRQTEGSMVELQQIIDSCQSIADFETDEILASNADASQPKQNGKKRRKREKRRYRCPVDGTLKEFGPQQTPWYNDYVQSPFLHCDIFHKKFRLRFRMAYESFQKHLKEVKDSALLLKTLISFGKKDKFNGHQELGSALYLKLMRNFTMMILLIFKLKNNDHYK